MPALQEAERLFRQARLLGAPWVRLLLDWIGSAQADEEHWRRAAEGLRRMSRTAEEYGVAIVLETHQEQLTDTAATTLKLLQLVGTDNVKVNLDIFNLFHMGEEPLRALDALWPHTVNVHLKNGVRDASGTVRYGIRLRDGEMNFKPFLAEIHRRRHDGFAAVEWFGERFWEAAKEELNWLADCMGRHPL